MTTIDTREAERAGRAQRMLDLAGEARRLAAYGDAERDAGAPVQPRAPQARAEVATRPQSAPERVTEGTVAVVPRAPVDGARVLTHTRKFLTRYARFPSESAATAVTLWVAASHFRDEAGVLVHGEFPILGLFSSEPGSGKTRVLELLSLLCPNAASILTEPSEAAVALLIGKHHRTLLLDEGDVLFGAGKRKAAIRAMLNAGYKRKGTWDRVRKGDVESIGVYGAKAIAGLDVLETGTGSALEALLSRFIVIRMRKAVGNPPAKPTERVGAGITGEDVGRRLHDLLKAWAAQERDALDGMDVEMPDGVELREEEKWGALLRTAIRADDSHNTISRQQDGEDHTDSTEWAGMAWDACTDLSLYGGTPDVIGETMDMLDQIEWED